MSPAPNRSRGVALALAKRSPKPGRAASPGALARVAHAAIAARPARTEVGRLVPGLVFSLERGGGQIETESGAGAAVSLLPATPHAAPGGTACHERGHTYDNSRQPQRASRPSGHLDRSLSRPSTLHQVSKQPRSGRLNPRVLAPWELAAWAAIASSPRRRPTGNGPTWDKRFGL